jgi:SAM-dependent methyltransferase
MIGARRTDKDWEYYGKHAPYFGVLTDDRFKNENLDLDAKDAFFASGEKYTEFLFGLLDEFALSFRPERSLDFGCGVGRLTLPLAGRSKEALGVDVAEGMLAEARENSRQRGLTNTSFVQGDDALSQVTGTFDLVHSFIVFQHIPPKRGEAIVKRMISLLRPDGVGALHFTYAFGSNSPLVRRLMVRAYKTVPLLFGLRNVVRGRPFNEPMMQMNEYSLNRLLRILEESGCHRVQVRFTETSAYRMPFYGALILFQKRDTDVRAHG